MSNPSFSNIDRWLFELKEGNLTEEQIALLEAFLIQHPELDVDGDMWDLAHVEAEPVVYPHQDKLIKKRPVGWYWASATAASIAIIVGAAFIGNDNATDLTTNHIASVNLQNNSKGTHNIPGNTENSSASIHSNGIDNTQNLTFQPTGINQLLIGAYPHQNTTINDPFCNVILPFAEVGSMQFGASSVGTSSNLAVSTLAMTTPSVKLATIGDQKRYIYGGLEEVGNEEEFEPWKLNRKHELNRKSWQEKLRSTKRKIQRMVDNPVALKNLKDPQYLVPGLAPTDVNFSSVGTLLATRVQTTSRYQWLGESNEQLSNQVQVDGYAYAIRGGIGLQLNQSMYANNGIQNNYAALTYSPKFSVSKNIVIEPAVRFKMGQKSINASQLELGGLVEDDRSNARQFYHENANAFGKSLWYRDLGASLMMNTKWFYVGMQADNLLRHEDNVYGDINRRADRHYLVTLGTDYENSKETMGLSPYIVYQKYENLSEAWIGANFRYQWMTVGAAVSSNLEPAASLGVKMKHVMVTYNADYTHSMALNTNALSHQLTLRFLSNPSRFGRRLLNQ